MAELINNGIKGFRLGVALVIITVVVIGIICACNAFGNTWTIQDGHFKEVYDNQ